MNFLKDKTSLNYLVNNLKIIILKHSKNIINNNIPSITTLQCLSPGLESYSNKKVKFKHFNMYLKTSKYAL